MGPTSAASCSERGVARVEHRQQRDDQRLGGALAGLGLGLGRALAVVVELGLQTLQRVAVLVALGLGRTRGVVVGHDDLAGLA